ncbi:MAG: hypothetical protein HQ566_06025, partial [Candidatus Omnitrophica bacterium]|nr:hypothetical protein [Candidatus Omnitrophota bacterium]
IAFLNAFPAYPADNSSPEKVTDISDRKYEEALIELLDNAKESIVVSMYGISPGSEGKNPVRLLLNDLLEARLRGVSVTMYLNTRFRDPEMSFIGSPVFKELKGSGCEIYLIPPSRKLHDKLIIIDNRYVVVGSTNWSNSALRRNFESNTLIDSPGHAQEKLKRLEDVLKFVKSNSEISGIPGYSEDLPEELSIPKELLLNKKYFSRMVTGQDERVFSLYLLLLAYGQLIGEEEFFINMEDMALSLGLPDSWSYTALRRQVIRSLKRLDKRYDLISVKFLHGKDAYVVLKPVVIASKVPVGHEAKPALPAGRQSRFTISSDSVIKREGPDLTLRLKFLLIIEALLKNEGEDLSSMAKSDLAARFNVNKSTIHEAFNDLKRFERK